MAIAPTQSPTAPVTASQKSLKSLSTNFDTFLTLLTTQLKNQDPMSPMDSNQFTQQLVQFSQVEQQIDSNQNLESLISLTKGRAGSDAVGYLGRTVTLTDGEAPLIDGKANWAYSLDSDTATTKLMVLNAKGKAVYVGNGETGSGPHAFNWNGQDSQGAPVPAGAYMLKVIAATGDGTAVAGHVASQATVTEVDLTGDEPILMLGPLGVPLSKAQLISAQ